MRYLLQRTVNLPAIIVLLALLLPPNQPLHAKENEDGVFIKGRTIVSEDAQKMFIAAYHGDLEKVRYFIEEKKVDVNYLGEFKHTTVLHWAAGSGNLELVQYLVDLDANIGAKDYEKKTPLHYAAQSGSLDTVIFLIRKGANPKYQDKQEKDALYFAKRRAHYDMIDYLEKKIK